MNKLFNIAFLFVLCACGKDNESRQRPPSEAPLNQNSFGQQKVAQTNLWQRHQKAKETCFQRGYHYQSPLCVKVNQSDHSHFMVVDNECILEELNGSFVPFSSCQNNIKEGHRPQQQQRNQSEYDTWYDDLIKGRRGC